MDLFKTMKKKLEEAVKTLIRSSKKSVLRLCWYSKRSQFVLQIFDFGGWKKSLSEGQKSAWSWSLRMPQCMSA